MDFFGAQDEARRATGWLVALFALAVALIMATVYFAAVVALTRGEGWWDPLLLLAVVAGVGLVVGGGSAVRSAALRAGGGRGVAEGLGGRQVPPDTADPNDRRLHNVVEEMAIAAGIPVPAVYVLDNEPGINAFAAGFGPDDAVVAVTRGTLDRLSRDELQGVIAHEFSHIFNRDIRLNIRLTGMIFGILALGLAGRTLLRASAYSGGGKRDGRGVAVALALGLALFVAGYAGVFFGRVIRAAVSRQREFLADAAAVQFTRNPEGLAGALRKIAEGGSALETPAAEEMSHFFFANGLRSGVVAGLWSTHPPLEERIRRLGGVLPAGQGGGVAPVGRGRGGAVAGLAAGAPVAPVSAARPSPPPPTAPSASAPPLPEIGERRLHALPDVLREAVHSPFSAVAATYALVLAADPDVAEAQWEVLRRELSGPLVAETERLSGAMAALPEDARLPLIDLAAPALHELSGPQAEKLTRVLAEVVRSDRRLSLLEFALETVVRHRLARTHGGAGGGESRALGEVLPAAVVLLSALAHAGHSAPEAVQGAFQAGVAHLTDEPHRPVGCTADDVGRALDRCSEGRPPVRAAVFEACMRTALYDRTLATGEAHLLRAFAAALGVPPPPVLPGLA